jgi:hypothetical protein
VDEAAVIEYLYSDADSTMDVDMDTILKALVADEQVRTKAAQVAAQDDAFDCIRSDSSAVLDEGMATVLKAMNMTEDTITKGLTNDGQA